MPTTQEVSERPLVTITEALAAIKTITKRITKKREGLNQFLARNEGMKDPLEREGGSAEFIRRERQAIKDLEEDIVRIRRLIAQANATTEISINGETRTIADWLTWRREVAPGQQSHLNMLQRQVQSFRTQAQQKGVNLLSASASVQVGDVRPQDIVVNISEAEMAQEADHLEEVLGTLDGLLSLKNATTTI